MGYYGWDPPEYDEPSDCYIEDATEQWYEMQVEENEDCMVRTSEYLRDSKMMTLIIEDLMKVLDEGEGFYCETEDDENYENRLRAIKIKNHLNLIDKFSDRIRAYIDNDLEFSCITEDDIDYEWVYEVAYEEEDYDRDDPDRAYEAWCDSRL